MASDQPLLDRGAFVISIDTELAWSVVHRGEVAPEHLHPDRVAAERQIVRDLLAIFEAYEVKATWAIVGHLFLDQCRPIKGRKHPEIVRPEYDWAREDWFDLDPATDIDRDPMWYGSDIVSMVQAAHPQQEIGSHSFSHLIVGDPGCSAEAFSSDLRACRSHAESEDIYLKSFVYPRNTIGHLDVLADAGFTSYRGVRPATFAGASRMQGAVARLVDKVWPLAGSMVVPERSGRLWNLPATNLYAPFDRARYLPFRVWVAQQVRRLEQAARHKSLFHLWFHPHNLLLNSKQAVSGLDHILRRASQLQGQGKMENLTMGELTLRLHEITRAGETSQTVRDGTIQAP